MTGRGRFWWAVRRAGAVLWRLVRGPRGLTRGGWAFLASTLAVGAAALNSGFNLLFLVFGMMMFLILANGVMSEATLRGLRVTRSPPVAVHAGTPYLMGIAVKNRKRRLPSFSIEVEDLRGDRPLEKRCYFLKIPAGREQQTNYRHQVARRGLHRLSGLRVATRFPFGLIRKSRDVDQPAEVLVYPALVPVPDALLASPALRGRRRDPVVARRGDFRGLREFRHGDDPRDIHWRTSARRGRTFVRESEEDGGRNAVILFDDAAPLPGTADGNAQEYEAAVSLVASLAVDLLNRGYAVGLGSRGGSIDIGSGPAQAARLLRHLALVQPVPPGSPLVDPGGEGARVRVRPAPGHPLCETLAGPGDAPA